MDLKLNEGPEPQAWVEINLGRFQGNIRAIRNALPRSTRLCCIIKDNAYGHGMLQAARIAAQEGAWGFALSNVHEGLCLREAGIQNPLLILGERHESEIPWCFRHNLTICLNNDSLLPAIREAGKAAQKKITVHLKINTGMNRYGIRWEQAAELADKVSREKYIFLEGALTHFAQSDEEKKDFANLQASRFDEALRQIESRGIKIGIKHLCNSGGFLDLTHMHSDMVRVGILIHGIPPSLTCKPLEGLRPVMSVKARIASIQMLEKGDVVGYGMRYTAPSKRRTAVLPIGYGDGFPRAGNEGYVLLCGKKAPRIGGVAMNAIMVDITDIPEAQMWSEAVIMGEQGNESITARDLGKMGNTVVYDILAGWGVNLPKKYV